MKQVKIMVLSKRKIKRNFFIIIASFAALYFLISLYFFSHFYFHTEINGIDVSLKAHRNFLKAVNDFVINYDLLITERSGEKEIITGQDIGMRYNTSSSFSGISKIQNPFTWICSIFGKNRYYIKDLFVYDMLLLDKRIESLNCLNKI